MTDIIAGQTGTLLSQWYDFEGGSLTDLDATPTIGIVSIATGATALAATTSGVTHPGTGSYGYAWTPTSALTPGAYLATWSGLKAGSPVTATETVTVIAPASAEEANTSPDGIWYATREDVMRALDAKPTTRNVAQIGRALESASRDVEDLCHRKFFPVAATRYFDWPSRQGGTPWVLRLDDQELISVSALTSGGTALTADEYNLEPVNSGPPYNRVEVNLGGNGSFGGGNTAQRSIAVTGLFGYRNTEAPAGALVEVLDASETGVDVDGAAAAALGVGSVIRVDSERMLVTGRSMLDTGQNLGGAGLTAQANSVTLVVSDGTAFAVDEVLLIESERMLITDIAGNNLTVVRAWDGTVLAAHAAGVDIYASRTLTVTRGSLGTTAAAHGSGTSVQRWAPPGLVRDLTIAEAENRFLQENAGYARTSKASSGSKSVSVETLSLESLRTRTYNACGRKARMRSV